MNNASRGRRFAATLVDAAAIWAIIGVGYALKLQAATAVLLLGIIGLQVWLLSKDGQTLGKKALKLRIVRLDTGENGGFVTNVLMRSLVGRIVLGLIPFYVLVDLGFIFREDQRCLHDLVAGTRVADAGQAPVA